MMRFFLTFSLCAAALFAGCSVTDSPATKLSEPTHAVYIVWVPPFFDYQASDGINFCRWRVWEDLREEGIELHSREESVVNRGPASCTDQGLPNGGVPIMVNLRTDGSLFLNDSHPVGNLSDTSTLVGRLQEIFRSRAENGVYREGKWEIDKSIAVDVPLTATYGELVQVVEAVQAGGSDDMILYLDNHLPKQIYTSMDRRRRAKPAK
jgi:biopolymer transport protein ExbD